ncbi:TrbC/VirB2 family protein [Cupriavidus taiwanensis]|uniref:TrbC/VirB2 family protein n=1 Tax=Cupriavidus taiwanensis TaxID=164546 RepID=UPI002540F044|nr:TrbC/VirB2 family protein [Cupriavidus taiwanensis]MDK3022949.1 TrbC/VirB2 family protein [Cupriavidus taiwanensis]
MFRPNPQPRLPLDAARTHSQRTALLLGAAMLLCAQSAFAADLGMFSGLTNMICSIMALVSGPVIFVIGVVVIILGAIGIANSESTIVKVVMTAIVGIGIAAAAIPIAKNMGLAAYC